MRLLFVMVAGYDLLSNDEWTEANRKQGEQIFSLPVSYYRRKILKPLSDFFSAIENDPRISITHIGIYAAILQYWSEYNYENPVQVFSYEIMRITKVSSAITYHKCVKDLSMYGYIKYEPSFNRKKGSRIYLFETFQNLFSI